jgi:hypothetical protein
MIGFSPNQFRLLPLVNGNSFRIRRQIVPEVLHELEFLGGTQIEDGFAACVHNHPCIKDPQQ